jgi:hypothetical protein
MKESAPSSAGTSIRDYSATVVQRSGSRRCLTEFVALSGEKIQWYLALEREAFGIGLRVFH